MWVGLGMWEDCNKLGVAGHVKKNKLEKFI
jgi:hypothetical protein